MPPKGYNFQAEKFKCFVRYLINVAQDKRCVTYWELENIFGLSHKQVSYYAAQLGDFCIDQDLPLLNGLIISATDCVPSEGFDWYERKSKMKWAEIISACWKEFRITSTRSKQTQNFSKKDKEIEDFLERNK